MGLGCSGGKDREEGVVKMGGESGIASEAVYAVSRRRASENMKAMHTLAPRDRPSGESVTVRGTSHRAVQETRTHHAASRYSCSGALW